MNEHGGDWRSFFEKNNKMPLDYSISVSPLGLPEGVKRACLGALDEAGYYPDPHSRHLKARLAARHGISCDNIAIANGASDIIYRIANGLRPETVLIAYPAFSEYEKAFSNAESRIIWYDTTENDFCIGEDFLSCITDEMELVILANPSNPAGTLTDSDMLQRIAERTKRTGAYFVTDECFIDFTAAHCDRPELPENVISIRAFTKLYGMPGIRLGYALCKNENTIKRIEAAGAYWSISNVAEAAGIAALEDRDYSKRLFDLIEKERPFLKEKLNELGFRVIDGRANYILFFCKRKNLAEDLEKEGIMIRDCRSFKGLGAGWYRIAVRSHEENKRLIYAIAGTVNS